MKYYTKKLVQFISTVAAALWAASYAASTLTPVGPSGISPPSWFGFLSAATFVGAVVATAAVVLIIVNDLYEREG